MDALQEFKKALKTRYGLNPEDVDMEIVEGYLNSGETPDEVLQYLEDKFDLPRVDEEMWI